ncbi:hypothetical protein BT67DRAFT_448635 [Trichocladium antarcticum]|uniref:Large ribosomal subunit protein uL30m n=1 Tax=Trichocladium antarcticum TaxID=1450529 RepID=A0AAN6UMA6_9PEZI|nr:hypothetical protein BT67DRAFT_448635 [Trichocladium antarcticum]
MSFFRITLHRSAIGLPKRTRGVLAALGLHKRAQVVFHPVEAQFAGMIMKVKELVQVEEVDRALTKREVHAQRQPEKGFFVERAVPRMGDVGVGVLGRVAALQGQGQGQAQEGEVRL